MGDRVVDCARLESVCARKAPGVRIPPHPLSVHYQLLTQNIKEKLSLFMTKVMTSAGKFRDVLMFSRQTTAPNVFSGLLLRVTPIVCACIWRKFELSDRDKAKNLIATLRKEFRQLPIA
jgi:hypothetical protein